MHRLAVLSALAFLFLACESSGGGEDILTGEPDLLAEADLLAEPDLLAAPDIPVEPEYPACFGRSQTVEPACAALVEGNNTGFMVDGEARTFYLDFPPDVGAGGPWPVIFNWHGYGDSAANMRTLLKDYVGGDYPFILVSPQGRGYFPPDGMEWDILALGSGESSEARLFDEILECLNQRFGVDPDRVHTVGFSAGAICSDMLGVLRGHCLASIVSFSGAYFTNPDTLAILGQAAQLVTWPAMQTENRYTQLMTHGGVNDNYPLFVATLQFDDACRYDADFLNDYGHDVVFCEHGGGHSIPFHIYTQGRMVDFLRDHPRGATSTYMEALPEGYPSYCEPRPAL